MITNVIQSSSNASNLFTNWSFPSGHCFQKLQKKALDYPKIALFLVAITSFFLGLLRLITFPLLCILGIITIPLIIIVKKIQKEENISKWILAWGLNLLSLAIIISSLFSIAVFAPTPMIFITFATAIFLSVSVTCIQINNSLYKNKNFFIKN